MMNREENQKKYDEKVKLLLDTFLELEFMQYSSPRKRRFMRECVKPKILEFIEKYADDYVEISQQGNMGYLIRKLTFDSYSREPKGTKEKGTLRIGFCPCGSHLLVSKKLFNFGEEEIQVLTDGTCYDNSLWNEFMEELEKENQDERQ
jgi:hypothetical protein